MIRPPDAVGIRHRDQADTVGQTNLPIPRKPRRRGGRGRVQPISPFRTRTRTVRHPLGVTVWAGRVLLPARVRPEQDIQRVVARAVQRQERRATRALQGTRRERIASLRLQHPALTRSQLAALDRRRRCEMSSR